MEIYETYTGNCQAHKHTHTLPAFESQITLSHMCQWDSVHKLSAPGGVHLLQPDFQDGIRNVSVWSHCGTCGPGAGQACPRSCVLCFGHANASCCQCCFSCWICPRAHTSKRTVLSRLWQPYHCCRPLSSSLLRLQVSRNVSQLRSAQPAKIERNVTCAAGKEAGRHMWLEGSRVLLLLQQQYGRACTPMVSL